MGDSTKDEEIRNERYKYCYEWRKVVLRHELWSQLPQEMVEKIAKKCIIDVFVYSFQLYPGEFQPSGYSELNLII